MQVEESNLMGKLIELSESPVYKKYKTIRYAFGDGPLLKAAQHLAIKGMLDIKVENRNTVCVSVARTKIAEFRKMVQAH